ncbi:MAG: hypothetical protein JO334_03365 [Verrucomicrobia bacterium]|nr:hypothetical protein [Verrucomicrobiota bacterium]
MSGDNPKAENEVTVSGDDITLKRDLSIKDEGNHSQTWKGKLYKSVAEGKGENETGNILIQGYWTGAFYKYAKEDLKLTATFKLIKQAPPKPAAVPSH